MFDNTSVWIGNYYLYNKPNNTFLYIHPKSNHPTFIVEQLPKMVNKRISDLSCDERVFNNATIIYKLVLKHSGYKSKIKFNHQLSAKRNKNRKTI